jgi:hypothetical protein
MSDQGNNVAAADVPPSLPPAGDTFRAAAAEQLGEWAKRANAKIGPFEEGAPPQKVCCLALSPAMPDLCKCAAHGHDCSSDV